MAKSLKIIWEVTCFIAGFTTQEKMKEKPFFFFFFLIHLILLLCALLETTHSTPEPRPREAACD